MDLKKKTAIRPLKALSILFIAFFSLFLSFGTELYLVFTNRRTSVNDYASFIDLIHYFSIKHLCILFCFFTLLSLIIYMFSRQISTISYRFRWLIGLFLIGIAVIFEISGSSIGIWQEHFTDPSLVSDGVLLGVNRGVRSDEWAVHTPLTFAQYYSDFSVFNNVLRNGSSTDMYMVYGQPVMDWSIIFRPFQIGYLFLSPARGLSFYWTGKLVMLFLISFEFGMLITKKSKPLAFTYAVMMLFAPVVQWWFGTVFFPEILIYGQSIVLLVSLYMQTKQYKIRILCGLGFILCGGAYLLVIYPAWQIPFFYIFAALAVWVIITKYKDCTFCLKKDLPILLGSVILLGAAISVILFRSWETVKAVMNSVYPGSRMETGGADLGVLFGYPGNLFLPFTTANLPSNQSEVSRFFDLFPIGIILSILVFFKDKTKDKLLMILWIVQLFLGTYIILGFPAALSKLTLLSNSQALRAVITIGFINILLLIRSLAVSQKSLSFKTAIPLAAVLSVAVTYYSKRYQYGDYLNTFFIIITILVLFILFAATLTYKQKRMNHIFCISICFIMFVSGAFVNPIRKGTKVLDDNRLAQAVQQIQKDNGGLWIAADSNLFIDGNFLAMNGAPTINATNTYPDLDLWKELDRSAEFEDIYNRYAHVLIDIVLDEPTYFTLETPDSFKIHLNINDLNLLGVDYIMTPTDLTAIQSEECSFTLLFFEDGITRKIYKVNYAESTE